MMIPQNKNVCQLVCHLYLDTAVGSELEGDRNSILSQASCRMDVTRIYKFIKEEEEVTR